MFKPSGLVLNQVVVDYEHFPLEINIPYLLHFIHFSSKHEF